MKNWLYICYSISFLYYHLILFLISLLLVLLFRL